MKKKILFILPGFTFGGTVFSTLNMISLLPKDKYEIYVFAMTHQGPVKQLYDSVKVLPENLIISSFMGRIDREQSIYRKVIFLLFKSLRRILKKFWGNVEELVYDNMANKLKNKYKFDIVCSCQEGPSTYFTHAFNDVKRIAWFRSEYKFYLERVPLRIHEYEKSIYPDFNKIVCVSKTTANDFIYHISSCRDKVTAIHNIQNIDNIIAKSNNEIDDELFKTELFTIVSVGRIDPQKRFSAIPEIAAKMKKRGAKFKWYIIGDGNVFGEKNKLNNNISLYDVHEEVILLGSKLNPYPYIRQSNLLVNTSYVEACPRVVMEAKILHIPVVCANFSSANEFVENDIDGYVAPIDQLDEHISQLILNNSKYCNIRHNCESFDMNNHLIIGQLNTLFGDE